MSFQGAPPSGVPQEWSPELPEASTAVPLLPELAETSLELTKWRMCESVGGVIASEDVQALRVDNASRQCRVPKSEGIEEFVDSAL